MTMIAFSVSSTVFIIIMVVGALAGLSDGVASIKRQFSRYGLMGMVVALAVLVCSATALADSASISVANTAGESDPAAGLPRVFTLSGSVEAPAHVFVRYRGPGGAPCAPTANEDTGLFFDPESDYLGLENERGPFWGPAVEGTFNIHAVTTWHSSGTFVFCTWIAGGPNEIVKTPITQTITFRSPNGTITATVNPLTPQPGQQTTVTVIGDSEAPENVYAKVRPAGGAPCAPTYEADSGGNLIDGASVNGSFSTQAKTTQSKAGQYLICLWLAGSGNETPVIAGPQPEMFTVASPPAPCVVPEVASDTPLASVEQKIRAADCTVGKISSVASTEVERGGLLSLNPAAGTKLSAGAAVNIVESGGRPCVVPVVKSGNTLAHVEHQLAAADCTASIGYLHSRRIRKGRVIGLASRPHAQLSPRAKVRVVVSAGSGRRR
jgi:hypothetical protein